MSFGSILLRLLLCLALAVNGTPVAMAAVHATHGVELAAAQHAQATPQPTSDAAGTPCHDMGLQSGSVGTKAVDEANDRPSPEPDCCKGACQCACAHSVASTVVPFLAMPVEYQATVTATGRTEAYAPPLLPHLIRPPIGKRP